MISLLAYRPLRTRNFAAIQIGRNLLSAGDLYAIKFDAEDTKTHRAIDFIFPEALAPGLTRYLEYYRPILLKVQRKAKPTETDALWISIRSTPLALRSIANPVNRRTREAFGTSLPPHWFRDAVATSIAIENPQHVRDIHLILGHTNLATAQAHYNQANSLQASRRVQAFFAELRASFRTRGAAGGP
jgi:integrase